MQPGFYRNLEAISVSSSYPMNPRDLPQVVAELIIKMPEVRTEVRGLRKARQPMPNRSSAAVFKSLELFPNWLPTHDDQLESYKSRLNHLEKPQ